MWLDGVAPPADEHLPKPKPSDPMDFSSSSSGGPSEVASNSGSQDGANAAAAGAEKVFEPIPKYGESLTPFLLLAQTQQETGALTGTFVYRSLACAGYIAFDSGG